VQRVTLTLNGCDLQLDFMGSVKKKLDLLISKVFLIPWEKDKHKVPKNTPYSNLMFLINT